jgi:cytochrome c551/c552
MFRFALLCLLAVASAALAEKPPHAALERYCIDCHDADAKKGGVNLDAILSEDIGKHAETWEAVVKQLNARHMPPIGMNSSLP